MGILELVLLGASLAMDAFAVSVCIGLSGKGNHDTRALACGVWFGGFQILMPLFGFALGSALAGFIESIDHWVALGLLAVIGINMIREGISGSEEGTYDSVAPAIMFPLALATSIDALAVGVTFAFLSVDLVPALAIIGGITFIISVAGVFLGRVVGPALGSRASIVGGFVLIGIGVKIVLEAYGIIP